LPLQELPFGVIVGQSEAKPPPPEAMIGGSLSSTLFTPYVIVAPHQVTAHMMQSRRPSGNETAIIIVVRAGRLSRKVGVRLDMIEKRRAIFYRALAIQLISLDWNRARRPFCIQQQKECQQQRDVMRHTRQRFAHDLFARFCVRRAISIV
jgi:hypothetical protein